MRWQTDHQPFAAALRDVHKVTVEQFQCGRGNRFLVQCGGELPRGAVPEGVAAGGGLVAAVLLSLEFPEAVQPL